MTDAKVKKWAETWARPDHTVWGYDRQAKAIAKAYLALLAKEAQRGEVLAVCPRCMTAEPLLDGVGGYWCFECGKEFPEPSYFQRVSKPDPAPETT